MGIQRSGVQSSLQREGPFVPGYCSLICKFSFIKEDISVDASLSLTPALASVSVVWKLSVYYFTNVEERCAHLHMTP